MLWIIYTTDGRELARMDTTQPKVAFMLWRDRGQHNIFPQDIVAAMEADGSCRITYHGETFVLIKEAPQ